jgi:hypothetical protein
VRGIGYPKRTGRNITGMLFEPVRDSHAYRILHETAPFPARGAAEAKMGRVGGQNMQYDANAFIRLTSKLESFVYHIRPPKHRFPHNNGTPWIKTRTARWFCARNAKHSIYRSSVVAPVVTATKRHCSGHKAVTSAGRSPNMGKFESSHVGTVYLRKHGFTSNSSRIPTIARVGVRARAASGQIDSTSRLRLNILFSYYSSKAMKLVNSSRSTSIFRLTPVRRPLRVS